MFITSDGKKFEDFKEAFLSVEGKLTDTHYEVVETTETVKWLHPKCDNKIIILTDECFMHCSILNEKRITARSVVRKPDNDTRIMITIVLGIFNKDDIMNESLFHKFLANICNIDHLTTAYGLMYEDDYYKCRRAWLNEEDFEKYKNLQGEMEETHELCQVQIKVSY